MSNQCLLRNLLCRYRVFQQRAPALRFARSYKSNPNQMVPVCVTKYQINARCLRLYSSSQQRQNEKDIPKVEKDRVRRMIMWMGLWGVLAAITMFFGRRHVKQIRQKQVFEQNLTCMSEEKREQVLKDLEESNSSK